MKDWAIDALLLLVVLACWLAAAGFLRLRTPLDRLHVVAFVNVVAGGALAVAAFISDGASDRAGKILAMLVFVLLSGAAAAHATGRAFVHRGSGPESPGDVER